MGARLHASGFWTQQHSMVRISQRKLEHFLHLKLEKEQAIAAYDAARREIVEMLQDNAPVEPGRFEAHIKEYETRQPTYAAIESILGEESLKVLRQRIVPRRNVNLYVVTRS